MKGSKQMLSKVIKFLQANLLLNLVSIVILLVITITVVYLTTYVQGSNIELQTVLEKKLGLISKDINELREMEAETLNLITEYHYLITERCAQLEEDSSDIQLYITTNYPKVPEEVANIIAHRTIKLCDIHNINISLVVGMIEVESSFNPFAVSKVNARGLMQVRFNVWGKELNLKHKSDLHDIETGIETGVKVILIYLENSNDDLTKALQKYNGIAHGSIYSNKVYEAMERFETFRANCRKDS